MNTKERRNFKKLSPYPNFIAMYPKKGIALKDMPREWFYIMMTCTCLWCFSGGFVNAICFAGPWHSGLTHITGSLTLSGTRVIIPAKPGQYTYYEYLLFCLLFALGSTFAGFILGRTWLRWGRIQSFFSYYSWLTIDIGHFFSKTL